MKDQVEFLKSMAITFEFIDEDQKNIEAEKAVEKTGVIAKLRRSLQIRTQ